MQFESEPGDVRVPSRGAATFLTAPVAICPPTNIGATTAIYSLVHTVLLRIGRVSGTIFERVSHMSIEGYIDKPVLPLRTCFCRRSDSSNTCTFLMG
jgi:hypothetical protein